MDVFFQHAKFFQYAIRDMQSMPFALARGEQQMIKSLQTSIEFIETELQRTELTRNDLHGALASNQIPLFNR